LGICWASGNFSFVGLAHRGGLERLLTLTVSHEEVLEVGRSKAEVMQDLWNRSSSRYVALLAAALEVDDLFFSLLAPR
jgi:hypothetical protein